MVVFQIENKDQHVWNKDVVLENLVKYFNDKKFTVGTSDEGPCLQSSGIEDLVVRAANLSNIDLDKITIDNGNLLKSTKIIKEKTINNLLELKDYQKFLQTDYITTPKDIKKHFGHFIGRSNFLRLWIATYLYTNFKDKTLQSFHWQADHDYHSNHLELEYLLNYSKDFRLIKNCIEFLSHCPLQIDNQQTYPILAKDSKNIRKNYNSIFVDVVCETYWSGNVFFVTEKTWRPIEQLTPFIVQGPQFFLKNLKQLGFETFDKWWPETYDDGSFYIKPKEIIQLIKEISAWSIEKCNQVYKEMMPILLHNRDVLSKLNWEKIQNTIFYNTESNEI